MPQVALPSAPTTKTDKVECWFEINLDFKEDQKRGRPTRIFTSTDDRWEKMIADPKLKTRKGSVMFGSYMASGEEFIPNTMKLVHSEPRRINEALERMKKFEKDGVIVETPKADLVKQHEEAVERGQERQAKMIADSLAQALASRDTNGRSAK